MKKLDQFLSDYLGKTKGYPDDSQYLGECLSIVKLYIKECFGIMPPPSGTNSAYGYWSNFPSPLGDVFVKVSNDPGVVPLPGDIVIWSPTASNSYGHIAIVKSADPSSSKFISYDQNWNSRVFQETSHYYTNVVGWLHPKGVTTSDPTIDQLKDEIEEKNQQISNYADQVAGWEKKYNECNTQRIEAGASADGFRKQLNDFIATLANILGTRQETAEIIASVKTCITYEDKADELDRQIALQAKEYQSKIDSLEKELASLKSTTEAKIIQLEGTIKELKYSSNTPIQPISKSSILEYIYSFFKRS